MSSFPIIVHSHGEVGPILPSGVRHLASVRRMVRRQLGFVGGAQPLEHGLGGVWPRYAEVLLAELVHELVPQLGAASSRSSARTASSRVTGRWRRPTRRGAP